MFTSWTDDQYRNCRTSGQSLLHTQIEYIRDVDFKSVPVANEASFINIDCGVVKGSVRNSSFQFSISSVTFWQTGEVACYRKYNIILENSIKMKVDQKQNIPSFFGPLINSWVTG